LGASDLSTTSYIVDTSSVVGSSKGERLMNRKVYALLLGLIALNCLDMVTTWIGLGLGLVEANPLRQDLAPKQKLLSVFIFCGVWALCWKRAMKENNLKVLTTILRIIKANVVFYIVIVLWNVAHILVAFY